MGKIVWDERLEIGIFCIDKKNHCFIENINELIDVITFCHSRPEIIEHTSNFAVYTSQHFRDEEKYLKRFINGLDFRDHRQRHLFFEDFLRVPFLSSVDDKKLDILEMIDFIADWVTFHIQYLDKQTFTTKFKVRSI